MDWTVQPGDPNARQRPVASSPGVSSTQGSSLETAMLPSPTPKAKPGAKWNKQRAIAQSCTQWSSLMVDLHAEVTKLVSTQQEVDLAMAKLSPQSQNTIKDLSTFNKRLYKIFKFWNSEEALRLDPRQPDCRCKGLHFRDGDG